MVMMVGMKMVMIIPIMTGKLLTTYNLSIIRIDQHTKVGRNISKNPKCLYQADCLSLQLALM